jgi:hypothetical protein
MPPTSGWCDQTFHLLLRKSAPTYVCIGSEARRRALRLDLPRPLRALNLQCLKLLHDDKGQITQLF